MARNQDHHREREIFEACLKRDPSERHEYLREACQGNAELKARISLLLSAHDAAKLAGTVALEPRPLPKDPERIGPYKILQVLGEGGMGMVYEAQQDRPVRRRVALKVIKLGMDTKQVVARFSAEEQALALMNHDSIAKVYDAGVTEEGRPYFVMELVKGLPLTEYCDQHQLSIPERLKLFIPVCYGVHHAHQKGVIHRDLKPSNVLVIEQDGRPVPKIIDFGIAKSLTVPLTEQTLLTQQGVLLGTPAYMSPEQLGFKPELDRGTDIYSLGVLLYELLVGVLPFKSEDSKGDIQAIREQLLHSDPPEPTTRLGQIQPDLRLHEIAKRRTTTPWTLQGLLGGDLRWVAMKAIAKESIQRYESAQALAEDLKRYLNGKPTLAQPPRLTYRIGNLVRRYRTRLTLAALLPLAIAVGVFVISKVGNEAVPGDQTAAERASIEASLPARSQSIAVMPFDNLSPDPQDAYFSEGLTEDILTQLSKISGLSVISKDSVARYKDSGKSAGEIGQELKAGFVLHGSVRRDQEQVRITARLIDSDSERNVWAENYDRELSGLFALQSEVAGQIASTLNVRLSAGEAERIARLPTENLTAYDHYLRGRQYYNRYSTQDNERAIEHFEKALELDPNFALAYSGLGDAFGQRVQTSAYSREWIDSILEMGNRAISLDPELANGYKTLALGYDRLGRYKDAIETNLKAVKLNPSYDPAISNLVYYYTELGDFENALRWSKRDLETSPLLPWPYMRVGVIFSRLEGDERAETWLQRAVGLEPDFSWALWELGFHRIRQGELGQASEFFERILAADPNFRPAINVLGLVRLLERNYAEAESYARDAIEHGSKYSWLDLGYLLWRSGRQDEAEAAFQKVIEIDDTSIQDGSNRWSEKWRRAVIHSVQGEEDLALSWLQQAIEAGWRERRLAYLYPGFENLWQDVRFERMMSQLENTIQGQRAKVLPYLVE